jgi:hypothetical protein
MVLGNSGRVPSPFSRLQGYVFTLHLAVFASVQQLKVQQRFCVPVLESLTLLVLSSCYLRAGNL